MSSPQELKKYEKINFKPTEAMANNAKMALEVRTKKPASQRGMTEIGLARARQLINRENLSAETVRRMLSYFQRHEVDKQGSTWKDKGKGWQAWNGWGGDEGYSWVKRIVAQMDKEDEKKEGEILDLEFKGLEIEIKQVDEKGVFKGVASPFGNVDLGNDRVLPSVATKNNDKVVPYLWQHDTKEPIGEVRLIANKTGIDIEGKLYLETLDNGSPAIPNAYKAYTLMKNGRLKNSIGYKTLDYQYVKEGKETVRDLKDIEIMEVSAVTFPMNPKATISNVKNEGGNKVEEKAMGFSDLLKVQQANDMRWKLQDALNMSFRQLMEDDSMDINAKVAQLEMNVDEFATAYKENMTMLLQASAKSKTAKKEILDNIETKEEDGELETKAGKKISKSNMEKIKSAMDMLNNLIGGMDVEDEEDDKSCGNKKPGMKESTEKVEIKQEPDKNDTIELKTDELEILQNLYKTLLKK